MLLYCRMAMQIDVDLFPESGSGSGPTLDQLDARGLSAIDGFETKPDPQRLARWARGPRPVWIGLLMTVRQQVQDRRIVTVNADVQTVHWNVQTGLTGRAGFR